jgi:DNA repair protein RecN (Recombination protein N)
MEAAQFQVGFRRKGDEHGAYAGQERLAFDETGIDQAEFLVSANPGEALKPMAKVASGGETARLMLALKTALAQVDATPTLIFDEIDQGIGGRIGDVVGRKLWGLTYPTAHQVIVVTHLPQLAGYGDSHFNVSKQIVNGRTTTAVTGLDTHGRVQELAAMLGTEGIHARRSAESILRQASKMKGQGDQGSESDHSPIPDSPEK